MAADVKKEDGVLVLTDANFDEVLKEHEYLLVEFYAPWCGHCKALAPEYSAAAEVLAKMDPPISIAKVDATEQKTIAEKFGVQGFPTLFWFKNGEKFEYNGGREKDTIVSWIVKKTGPPSAKVDCAKLKEEVENNKFVLAFFGAESDDLFKNAFVTFAEKNDKLRFFHSEDADCAKEFGGSAPGVVFFRKFETQQMPYDGEGNADALEKWTAPLMVPTVFLFDDDKVEFIFDQQKPALFLFRGPDDAESAFQKTFEEAASTHKGKILFSFSGVKDGIQERLAEFMGITEKDLPSLRAIMPENMKKFVSPVACADLTVDIIGKFADDVLGGNIKPHMKSQAPPVPNDGPLTVVVGTEYEKIVMDPTKDVFVKFYAPWCGHCKAMAPHWEKVAEHYKDNKDLIIADFDSTENEAEGVEVESYPTVIFYPKDNKAGVKFDGEREEEPIKKWLEENSPVLKEGGKKHDEL